MKTDRQVYRLFQANPEWLFELTRLESLGPSEFRSFTVKSLQRDADGVVVPHDASQPLTVVEVQFQPDDTIYPRIVTEMAAVQVEHQMRAVQGIILFRFPHLDPQTTPWNQVVRAFLLRDLVEVLQSAHPEHPLVAVFQPVLLSNEQILEQRAVQYYRQIKGSTLPDPLKMALLEIFVSWLEQRLPHMSKKEMDAMFLGELPDLEDTQLGKDLIEIGEKRGEAHGIAEAILMFLETQRRPVPEAIRLRLRTLPLPQLQGLLRQLYKGLTLEELEPWLAAHGSP